MPAAASSLPLLGARVSKCPRPSDKLLSPLPVVISGTYRVLMPACPVLLALLPVPGSSGHWHRQLLHPRAHHPGRPLCEGPADPGTGYLLHLYSCWKVSSTLDPLPGVVN